MGKAKRRARAQTARTSTAVPAPVPPSGRPIGPTLAVSAVLAAAVVAVYAQTARHQFVDFDDNDYVSHNAMVRGGLSARSVRWALTTFHFANWHPLTWLSHMLDCQLFGVDAGAHLLVNMGWHAANTVLLLLVLARMTGQLAPAAATAGLFALHPLHVESVAWIAERKDVLSTFFWILAMGAHAWYAKQPSAGRYAAVAASMAAGLMAKPMVVTLPFVLLLLDVWPLGRLPLPAGAGGRAFRDALPRLLLEKAPLLLLSFASSVLTFVAQREAGAVQSLTRYPFAVRAGNAALAYTGYLAKTLWPSGLCCYYPYRPVIWLPGAVLAGLALAGATALAARTAARRPYLLVGWLWYLGTLVPVIGLVQVGGQAMADRYTYVPLIGVFVAVAWQLQELAERRPAWRHGIWGVAVGALLLLGVAAHRQAGTWRDRMSLFSRAVAVTQDNSLALGNLADALRNAGRNDEALRLYEEALRIDPASYEANVNMGITLARVGRTEEALARYRRAAEIRPTAGMPHYNMAPVLIDAGRVEEAAAAGEKAVALEPGAWEAHYNLGLALARLGQTDRAVARFHRGLELNPGHVDILLALGITLGTQGKHGEAAARFSEALALDPTRADVHYAAGNLSLQQGKAEPALPYLREAVRLQPGHADAWNNLGVALMQLGRHAEAAAAFQTLVRLRPSPQAEQALAMAQAAAR